MSTDAELVVGTLAGDRRAFESIYGRYADRLFDFCMSVLRDPRAAGDAVRETFALVAQRLGQLNDPHRLRPWLYGTAREVLLRHKATAVSRSAPSAAVASTMVVRPAQLRLVEQTALREAVWGAVAELPTRDRVVLDLYLRQGFDGAELAEVLGIRAGQARELLTRVRDQTERALGAFLVARLGRRECATLDTLLSGWEGRFSPAVHKRAAQHVDHCGVCDWRRRSIASPLVFLAAMPLMTAPTALRRRAVSQVELVAPQRPARSLRPLRLPLAAAGATLLLILTHGLLWDRLSRTSGRPTALDQKISEDRVPTQTFHSSEGFEPDTTLDDTVTASSGATGTTSGTPGDPGNSTTSGAVPDPNPAPGGGQTVIPTQSQPTTTTTTTAPRLQPPPPPDTTEPRVVDRTRADATLFVAPCSPNQTQIRVTATDNVGIVSATMYWTNPGGQSGTTAMTFQNGQWHAALGPFAARGTAKWYVVVADAAGNIAAGQTDNVPIGRCRH